ncbi:MAG TPA: hypothetical protein VLX58_15500, partial [Bryobacteraceae bacterium]|nr:hypothetical protein [Bryobacteraceae bacterium]
AESNARAAERSAPKPRIGLFWPLAVSAALNAALLVNLGVGRRPAETVEPQFYQSFAIPPASRSAAITNKVPVGSRFFGARFDLPEHHFTSFSYEILDRDGRSYSSRSLKPPSGENSQLELAIPVSSLKPGVYVVILSGREQANSTEISRAQFLIQE